MSSVIARAPHRATIEVDLWVWERARAWKVLDQILAALETLATDDEGGHGVHHTFSRADLRRVTTGLDASLDKSLGEIARGEGIRYSCVSEFIAALNAEWVPRPEAASEVAS